jgi:hypothetical protein
MQHDPRAFQKPTDSWLRQNKSQHSLDRYRRFTAATAQMVIELLDDLGEA